jgi:hypothetical protein
MISNNSFDLGRFFAHWVDAEDDYLPSINALKDKKWEVLPIADFINPMEAEWLSEAILGNGIKELIGVNFEYGTEPEEDKIQVSRDSIMKYNMVNTHRYIYLTSRKEDFIYFKDQENRFFLLCGDPKFIQNAYKCSIETAQILYFDFWVDSNFHTDEERIYLTDIWEKYISLGGNKTGSENSYS